MTSIKIAAICLLVAAPALGQVSLTGAGKAVPSGGAPVFSGPGDTVAGWTAWWGLRAYSATYASGAGKAINVRAASGANSGTTTDIVFLSNGNLDQATARTFGGTDATGVGAISGTTLTFTGGTIGDQVTGGTALPGTVIVSGATPTWTVNLSQTVVSATLTLFGGLFVTEMYDQTGNANHLISPSNVTQPILAFNTLGSGNTLPSVYFGNTSGSSLQDTSFSATAQPTVWSWVGERVGNTANFGDMFITFAGGVSQQIGFGPAPNFVSMNAGTSVFVGSIADNASHAVQNLLNSASSQQNVDGSQTTGVNPGTAGVQTAIAIGGNLNGAANALVGFYAEGGLLAGSTITTTQQGSMHTNQSAYWGTP